MWLLLFELLLHCPSCCNGNRDVQIAVTLPNMLKNWFPLSQPEDSSKDFRSSISHSSPFLLSALDVYLESLIDDHSVLLLRKLVPYVKEFTWMSKVRWIYDVHRRTSLLSNISRGLCGIDTCLPDSKEIGCSEMLEKICRASLKQNRQTDQLQKMWPCDRIPELSIQWVP